MYWIQISSGRASDHDRATLPSSFSDRSASRNIVGIGLIAGLTALILSGSRGPILSVFVVLGFAFLVHARQHSASPQTKKILAAAIGFAVVGFAVMVARSVMEYQVEPHHSLGLRAQILSETLQQILRTPWFGLGIDQAGQFFAGLGLPTTDVNHAHNSLLNAVLEMGVLGGLAFVWLFFTLGIRFYQHRADSACQLALALLGFFFLCSMTQDILSHSFTRKLLAFYLAILIVWAGNAMSNKNQL
jgi:O-antigen ligase